MEARLQQIGAEVNVPGKLLDQIIAVLRKYLDPNRIIIYGSRVRGDHRDRSDIDIAVDHPRIKRIFREEIEEEILTLLRIDIVNLDEVGEALRREINEEGVVIYGKT